MYTYADTPAHRHIRTRGTWVVHLDPTDLAEREARAIFTLYVDDIRADACIGLDGVPSIYLRTVTGRLGSLLQILDMADAPAGMATMRYAQRCVEDTLADGWIDPDAHLVLPTLLGVDVDVDPHQIRVRTLWAGVDRPDGPAFVLPPGEWELAVRLERAIRAGAVCADMTRQWAEDGSTYAGGIRGVSERHLARDLARLGF